MAVLDPLVSVQWMYRNKPHLKWSSRINRWACIGRGVSRVGLTPFDAYTAWVEDSE